MLKSFPDKAQIIFYLLYMHTALSVDVETHSQKNISKYQRKLWSYKNYCHEKSLEQQHKIHL